MTEARANPSKNGQFRSGTLAEIQATALLEGQPGWATDGKSLFVGSQASGNQQIGGTVWANDDLSVRWDPNGNGGAGTGDGLTVTSTGIVRHKPGSADAQLDHQTQGRGYLRIRGTTDSVPVTPPGNNSTDIQIKRAGSVGVQQADSHARGEDISILAAGCIADGGIVVADSINGASRGTMQFQATHGWNQTTAGIRVGNYGQGNTVYGTDVGASGIACSVGNYAQGTGPGWVWGYKSGIYGAQAAAGGIRCSANGVSTGNRRNPVTVSTVAGVTSVVVPGDVTAIYNATTQSAPVFLWGFNASINSNVNGWAWRSAVASSSFDSVNTTIVLVDAVPNAAVTSALLCVFSSGTTTSTGYADGLNSHTIARRASAMGYGGLAVVDNTANIGGALISRKDWGDVANGDEVQALSGAVITLYSKLVDLKVAAPAPVVTIPANSVFFPHECGIEVRAEFSAVTVQPTVKMGVSGNTAKHRAAAQTTHLTAANKQDKSTVTTDDGETSLQGEVTVGATGTTCQGYFFWTGRLVQTG